MSPELRLPRRSKFVPVQANKPNIDSQERGRTFIREAMKSAAITNEALAQKLNVIRNTVQLWFKKDDITISNIYKIAEGYGLEVNITFKLKKV